MTVSYPVADQGKKDEHRVPRVPSLFRAVVAQHPIKVIAVIHLTARNNVHTDLPAKEGDGYGAGFADVRARFTRAAVAAKVVFPLAVLIPLSRHHPDARDLFAHERYAVKRRQVVALTFEEVCQHLHVADLDKLHPAITRGKQTAVKPHSVLRVGVFDGRGKVLGKPFLIGRLSAKVGAVKVDADGHLDNTVRKEKAAHRRHRVRHAAV